MTLITREADYALRTILYLASVQGERVSAAELSERMDIPYRFLRNITRRLVKAEILFSHRGQQGGLELAREPGAISLLDVLRAVSERSCLLNACLGEEGSCSREAHCSIHSQLELLQTLLDEKLGELTFERLVAKSPVM
ncbi:MAG: RrF2 family transcriptional regulator [Planctomycetota bacterium]